MIPTNNNASNNASRKKTTPYLVFAAILTFVLWHLPFSSLIVYPFRLFTTYIHESGHAVATIFTGGNVHGFNIYRDGSGVVQSSGGIGFIIAGAGYLGSALAGGLLMYFGQSTRPGRILTLIGVFTAVITLGYVRDIFGLFWGVFFSFVLLYYGLKGSRKFAAFFLHFLAIQVSINALDDLYTLFVLSPNSKVHTDAHNMFAFTGIPAPFWAVLWAVIAVWFLWLGLKVRLKKG